MTNSHTGKRGFSEDGSNEQPMARGQSQGEKTQKVVEP